MQNVMILKWISPIRFDGIIDQLILLNLWPLTQDTYAQTNDGRCV